MYFVYGNITLYVESFQITSTSTERHALMHIPHMSLMLPLEIQIGLTPFRSLLLRGSLLISFHPFTKMFQFKGFAFQIIKSGTLGIQKRIAKRKSYSGILRSKVSCTYLRHIAAWHALHSHSSLSIHQTASARSSIILYYYATIHDDNCGLYHYVLHSSRSLKSCI